MFYIFVKLKIKNVLYNEFSANTHLSTPWKEKKISKEYCL